MCSHRAVHSLYGGQVGMEGGLSLLLSEMPAGGHPHFLGALWVLAALGDLSSHRSMSQAHGAWCHGLLSGATPLHQP